MIECPGTRSRARDRARAAVALAAGALVALAAAGCGNPRPPAVAWTWLAARPEPAFDPEAPPEPLRAALEGLLTRALVESDSAGRPVPAACSGWSVSEDSLLWTFTLREGLAFTDATPCSSVHFARALRAGVARADHGTRAWAFGALRGMEAVRPGRPLPALGIETPAPGILRLRLSRPEPRLPERLAMPGASGAWKSRDAAGWVEAVGLGPFRVDEAAPGRLTLVRAGAAEPGAADTLRVRFVLGAARVRSLLRTRGADLVWPLPPTLLDEPLPQGYSAWRGTTQPARHLALVLRADTPPTTRIAARRALTHGVSRPDVAGALGVPHSATVAWFEGAPPFAFARFDQREVAAWLERGRLGRSFHVVMAYDADGAGAEVARRMQGEWSAAGLYVDLDPLRGRALSKQLILGGDRQIALVETWPAGVAADPLAPLVQPVRGPAVGSFRTGWRTREFDPWLAPRGPRPPFDAALAQRRLEQEAVLVPLAPLDWRIVAREGLARPRLDPALGPDLRAAPEVPGDWVRMRAR